MHGVGNLATMQTPLATFISPFKKASSDQSLGFVLLSQCAHTPLSLSLCLLSSASGGGEQCFQLNTYYVSSLILLASIPEITAELLSLSYVYLISSDDSSIIRIFVQINIMEGRTGYVVSMGRVSVTISYSFRCLMTETVKYINENCFIENKAASKYSMLAKRGKQMKQ